MAKDPLNRTVEKIDIVVTIDKPDPMPMMMVEHIGTGKNGQTDIEVTRNLVGNLLLIKVGRNGYVVDVKEIVQGIISHENGFDATRPEPKMEVQPNE